MLSSTTYQIPGLSQGVAVTAPVVTEVTEVITTVPTTNPQFTYQTVNSAGCCQPSITQ